MSENLYEQLLPYWRRFCASRRAVEHDKNPDNDWLFSVGARGLMRDAYLTWNEAIKQICGAGTLIEWPDQEEGFVSGETYIEGPCIVAGIMLFSDKNHS